MLYIFLGDMRMLILVYGPSMDNVIGYTTASPELCLHTRVKLNVDRLLSLVNNNIILICKYNQSHVYMYNCICF